MNYLAHRLGLLAMSIDCVMNRLFINQAWSVKIVWYWSLSSKGRTNSWTLSSHCSMAGPISQILNQACSSDPGQFSCNFLVSFTRPFGENLGPWSFLQCTFYFTPTNIFPVRRRYRCISWPHAWSISQVDTTKWPPLPVNQEKLSVRVVSCPRTNQSKQIVCCRVLSSRQEHKTVTCFVLHLAPAAIFFASIYVCFD